MIEEKESSKTPGMVIIIVCNKEPSLSLPSFVFAELMPMFCIQAKRAKLRSPGLDTEHGRLFRENKACQGQATSSHVHGVGGCI